MVWLSVRLMLATCFVDITIGLIWIGLIGYGEIIKAYKQVKEEKNGKTN